MTIEKDLATVQALKMNDECFIDMFEEGGCQVNRVEDMFVLHEIPQYGGTPRYIGIYHLTELKDLVIKAHSLT